MPSKIIMPQGGQDLEFGRVVRWLKQAGDPVKKGEIVCEVETEKAVLEVPAPSEGILAEIHVADGEDAKVFSTIATIRTQDEGNGHTLHPLPAAAPAAPVTATPAGSAPTRRENRIRISPKAKRISAERGIAFEQIKGSGPYGRIVSEDVLRFAASMQAARAHTPASASVAAPVRPAAAPPPIPVPQTADPAPNGGRPAPMTKIGRVTARRMATSKQTVPHFYVTTSVDMTAAAHFRDTMNVRPGLTGDEKLSFTDLIVRASALALRVHPQVNCSAQDEETLLFWEDVHIGIAAATDEGLVVPVLEHADRLSLEQIARESRCLVAMARDGRQASSAPAHFTISNLGMFNVDNFIAIINPPESAILAVSSIRKQLIPIEDGGFVPRDMMALTLSMDHRVGDGVLAARFLNELRTYLENPDLLR